MNLLKYSVILLILAASQSNAAVITGVAVAGAASFKIGKILSVAKGASTFIKPVADFLMKEKPIDYTKHFDQLATKVRKMKIFLHS